LSKDKDINLRFFEACTKYNLSKDDLLYTHDKKKFSEKHFPKIAESITKKLNASGHVVVTWKNVTILWSLCAYDYIINQERNKFCSLFSKEDFELIETYYDISSYFDKGYGWDLSYEIACPLVADIVDIMEKKISGSDKITKAYLRFAHAETILPLIARLGLYNDSFKLNWDTDISKLNGRKWRTSELSTFSANLAFVLYHCENNEYKVEVMLNEGQVKFDGCSDIFCPFDQFKNLFPFIKQCNFDSICGIQGCITNNGNQLFEREIVVLSVIFVIFIVSLLFGLVSYFKCSGKYKVI